MKAFALGLDAFGDPEVGRTAETLDVRQRRFRKSGDPAGDFMRRLSHIPSWNDTIG